MSTSIFLVKNIIYFPPFSWYMLTALLAFRSSVDSQLEQGGNWGISCKGEEVRALALEPNECKEGCLNPELAEMESQIGGKQ